MVKMYTDMAKTFMNYLTAKSWLILVKIQDLVNPVVLKILQLPYPANPDILKSKVRDPVRLVRNMSGPKNATWLNTVTLSLQVFTQGSKSSSCTPGLSCS